MLRTIDAIIRVLLQVGQSIAQTTNLQMDYNSSSVVLL